ncbi:peptide ABC transporter permease [Defluviimonas sp. 20V17]|uniref:Peptide ABC transporter permease n=1 Tax=Allgaiera indica TaxID=765699 RepID=A0AAN4UN72_9RHOB|nr:DMT family transporter [Allgaiera indica]KDB02496.1 peptide ABC transporter permease [Defluviimonas sp. 20V17]GHD98771.1 peptide ABC transporter permease [Allgaiera indica]SDW06530.1 Permease of the drug/metabolite transporter (DMT) superfamily [Allgaiera indica]
MDLRAIGMGLAFALMWSSAFTSARMIVADAPPLYALSLRFLISGLLGIAIAFAIGQRIRLTRGQWRATIIFGISQNALYLGLNFVAMQWVQASLAAIVASTMPLIVAFASWALLGERIRPLGIAGLVAGVVGVAIIMGARMEAGVNLPGLALCGLGVLALAAATLSVRGASSGGNLLMVVGLQMLIGSACLGVVAGATEHWAVQWSPRLVIAFFYTTLVPGLAATWVWFELVKRIGAVRAATFHFLNPFFGVIIAALLLHERLGWADGLGVAIVAFGILAVQISRAPNRAGAGGRQVFAAEIPVRGRDSLGPGSAMPHHTPRTEQTRAEEPT